MAGIKITKDETFDGYVTEKVNVIKNDLLGDYNENGKYIINEKVVLELLQLEKVKRSTFNNSIFCTSYMPGFGEITFELELKKQGDNGIAVIYVLEKVDKVNGYIQNTLRTQVAIYKDVLTPDFIERSFEGFNIKRREDEEQKTLDPEDFNSSLNTYIGARKHFSELLDNVTADEYNEMYQEYFNQRIKLLKEDGSNYAKLVLNNYSAEYDKIKDYFLKNEGAVDYKALNELLDKCFEDVNGLDPRNREKEEEFKKKLIPFLHALMMKAQAISTKGKQQVVQKAKANEKEKLAQIAKDKEKIEKSKTEEKSKEKPKEAKSSAHPINDNKERLKAFMAYADSKKAATQAPVEEKIKPETETDNNMNIDESKVNKGLIDAAEINGGRSALRGEAWQNKEERVPVEEVWESGSEREKKPDDTLGKDNFNPFNSSIENYDNEFGYDNE